MNNLKNYNENLSKYRKVFKELKASRNKSTDSGNNKVNIFSKTRMKLHPVYSELLIQ
jgi:hypothetical protein